MVEIKINNRIFSFEKRGSQYLLNNVPVNVDLQHIDKNLFHLIADGNSYEVELIKTDENSKRLFLKIGNSTFETEVKTHLDLLLERMGMNFVANNKMNILTAPMPGLIADVRVVVGEKIMKDMPLLVLEAMKMENMIKSHGEGQVKKVLVIKGDHVEKGQVLMEFE